MVEEILVDEDIATGRNVIEAPDRAKFPVEAAFWLYESSLKRWTLWIATPRAKRDLQKAYIKVREILDGVTDREVLDLPGITLASPVLSIKSRIGVKDLADFRLRRRMGIHGVYIEDALIYRTAA